MMPWMAFKKSMCKAKHKHFDERIDEIAHTNLRPWDLMDWVGSCLSKQDGMQSSRLAWSPLT
jgi:hypothetical protein